MNRLILAFLLTTFLSLSCLAGDKESVISGQSEAGKVKLLIKSTNADGRPSSADLIVLSDTVRLIPEFEAYTIADMPNHLFTIFFKQRDIPLEAPESRQFQIWAIPSSFVKMEGHGENSWRFTAKVKSNVLAEVVKLECTYTYSR